MLVISLNALFILAGFSGFELLPAYAKNEAGVTETAIGAVFFVNTVVIVLTQLPVTRASEGRRRVVVLALLGVTWAVSWLLVPVAGTWLQGAAAALLIGAAMALFGLGECLHAAVQAPLPNAVWVGAAALCLAAGALALLLERALPVRARRTPVSATAS